MSAAVDPFGIPPEEAQRWFREKGYKLAFDWREVYGAAHARAFSVAKATQLDVLADIREAVDRAISKGATLADFKKDLRPVLQSKGWWGEKEAVDPKDGQSKVVQLGSANRLKTIYETNLRQAQAAGRWERAERVKAARPYARYVHINGSTSDSGSRAAHQAWHGLILPLDDPFWDTHAPPNGWGCRCKLQMLSERDLQRFNYVVARSAPKVELVTYVNERTGKSMRVPKGIDPSFDYNPGKVPRGFTPPDNAPELEDVRTFRDEGLPSAKELRARGGFPEAVDRWHDLKNLNEAGAKWNALFGGRDAADVTDPDGMQVSFSTRALLHMWNAGEKDRASFVPRAKQTVEQPAEIWLVPHRLRDGRVVMRKRYIGMFEGRDQSVVVIVQRDDVGNAFWTAYPSAGNAVDKKRQGYLLYPRPASSADA